MKRELVVFSVIGGLLWIATGLSVLAITVLDTTGSSQQDPVVVIDGSHPDRIAIGDRSRDAETSAPLCETRIAEPSHLPGGQESDPRSAEANCTGADSERCWHDRAVSLLHYCLLLT